MVIRVLATMGANVTVGKPDDIAQDTIVHRVSGGRLANLQLSAGDRQQRPPGISVLLGGSPQDAAKQMRQAFPKSRKWQQVAATTGSTTAAAIRLAGFEIVPDPTGRFPNHARLIHPADEAGFTDENLKALAAAFRDTIGC